MDITQLLAQELEQEYRTTQQFFALYPAGKEEYVPHAKSMKLGHLVTHIAEIFSWPGVILPADSLDLATQPPPEILSAAEMLLQKTKRNFEKSHAALLQAKDADLIPQWALKHKDHVLAQWDKYSAIRHALSQITHHRAQLGVYYRLNDIKLPGSYGPTADTPGF